MRVLCMCVSLAIWVKDGVMVYRRAVDGPLQPFSRLLVRRRVSRAFVRLRSA
jgi:hypothetical protein